MLAFLVVRSGRVLVCVAAVGSIGLVAGCQQTTTRAQIRFSFPERTTPGPAEAPEPTIVSAHAAYEQSAALGDADGMIVVFSQEVDPMSLDPRFFMVMFADGARVRPREAVLAPANERDENRSVLLIGDFGDPTDLPPADVMVIGPLYAEGGQRLRGLAASVTPYASTGRPVFAHALPAGASECGEDAVAIRTYWDDALRGVTREDLAGIRVEFAGGSHATPLGFGDHSPDAEDGEDNVLDLCVPASAQEISRLEFDVGLFADAAGHASGGATIPVEPLSVPAASPADEPG